LRAVTSAAQWEPVIGLELHVQLLTRSKLFSGTATAYGAEPNAQASAVDLGYPGTLPVPNAEAIRLAIRFGLAIEGRIAAHSVFARKNYFYPDLPKGYQISQYEEPIVAHGRLVVRAENGREFEVAIERAHLEEDAGKSVHDAFHGRSAIDLNRAGVPLLEVVSAPVLHSPEDAVAYMRAVHNLVRWLGFPTATCRKARFRCDANVSVPPSAGAKRSARARRSRTSTRSASWRRRCTTRSSARSACSRTARTVEQETRLYDPAQHRTRAMRGKESAHDYRYFPDPDLPPLRIAPRTDRAGAHGAARAPAGPTPALPGCARAGRLRRLRADPGSRRVRVLRGAARASGPGPRACPRVRQTDRELGERRAPGRVERGATADRAGAHAGVRARAAAP
jgi:aspartyl-tRNA(Asn)/glutamyl-tRNA(Gln) amidotransferase subunit B